MAKGNPDWVKGGVSPNPHGRPPGPAAPTMLLKDAFLLAAREAGGGGENGLRDYLIKVALSHPQVFVPALSKIIPFEVNLRGNGNITIKIVKSADEPDTSRPEMKVINGHANGSGNGSANGSGDPASE